jgi:hypothetical protein
MRLLLHIGTPKTGTTALQEFLFLNRDSLKSRGFHQLDGIGKPNNILFTAYFSEQPPSNIVPRYSAINKLGNLEQKRQHFRENGFIENLDTQLEKIKQMGGNVIISSEQLSQHLRTPAEIENLMEWSKLRFEQVRIACVVREPRYSIPAAWATNVRNRGTRSLEGQLREALRDLPKGEGHASYDRLAVARLWSTAFGIASLDLFDYQEPNLDIRRLFADHYLGGTSGLVLSKSRANESPNRATVEAWRLANLLFQPFDENLKRSPLNLRARGVLAHIVSGVTRPLALTRRQARRLAKVTAPLHEKFNQEFGNAFVKLSND